MGALADLYRRLHGRLRPIWAGVYARYEDVPASGPGFAGETWTAMTREHTERTLAALRGGTPPPVTGDRALLPMLSADVLHERQAVRIVDFGGGMGSGYIDVRSATGLAANVDYVVIETAAVCAGGRSLFAGDPAIRFVTSFDDAGSSTDIVYANSALQYVTEPLATLRTLAGLGARHILLVNFSAGDIPTYVTAQRNVPGSVIPYWFLAAGEVVDVLRSVGYERQRESASERRLTGFAVPPTYRLDRGRNLLFERVASRS